MARSSRRHRSRRHRKQRGGGWGFTGPAFSPAAGMAPIESRALTDDCATVDRSAPSVAPTGAWSQSGGGCGSCAVMAPPPQQLGGGLFSWLTGNSDVSDTAVDMEAIPISSTPVSETPSLIGGHQRGGGGGTGGYGFVLNNDFGKVYPSLSIGSCPSVQQRGGDRGVSLGDASIVSYPAGYGYAPASAMEVGNGTAHFLAQIPYGKQCMGGGARRKTHHRKQRKSRKGVRKAAQRKSRCHH